MLQVTDDASATTRPQDAEPENQEELLDRVLGRLEGSEPGPTLIWIGGLHGNEPAGVTAIERLFEGLKGREDEIHGEVLGLAGNRRALAVGQRFIDQDLNRIWSKERLEELRAGHLGALDSVEGRELVELWTELEAAFARARGPIYIVDFHTTSGPGCGFAVIPDTLHSRSFAMSFPVPSILGLEEEVEGTVADYLGNRGFVIVGFEGGQHDEPSSVHHCAAAGWVSLAVSGALPESEVPEIIPSQQLLHKMGGGLPHFMEVRYRHSLEDEDGFVMREGFTNFRKIKKGQLLAGDKDGEIRSQIKGRILMPLYQKQGNDGFFVVRRFSPVWLWISTFLRSVQAGRAAHLLPGVKHDPENPDILIVERKVARWYAMEIFHLLGFRRHRIVGDRLIVSRRPQKYQP